ncbi:MAG: hypothetical protein L3K09_04235 [Thermoplasmata archaeon]|nr:hypothetical protein [Thermoplasmata archaeon]
MPVTEEWAVRAEEDARAAESGGRLLFIVMVTTPMTVLIVSDVDLSGVPLIPLLILNMILFGLMLSVAWARMARRDKRLIGWGRKVLSQEE